MSRHGETRPLADLTDDGLMKHIQDDDVLAFEELYRRHSARALSLARVICHVPGLAEEATQDGFVSVWRARMSYDDTRGTVRGWLLAVVRHRSIDLMRREASAARLSRLDDAFTFLEAPGSVVDDTERNDEAARLRVSLLKLPLFQREVIGLAYFGGLTHTEIAGRLGVPVGTVKGRMRLGLIKVRDEAVSVRSDPGIGPVTSP